MKRLTWLLPAAVFVISLVAPRAAVADKQPLVNAKGPTVVAFFPPVTDAELQKEPDTNEALADFQLYASRVHDRFKKKGIEFHELYTHSRFEFGLETL